MRSELKFAVFVVVLFLCGGCEQKDPGPPNMMPQILGALQIRDARERDAALAAACRESADQGSAPAVLMGIQRIEDVDLRDEVAADCAISLGDSGQIEAAVEVAKLISSESKRDELLAKLMAGSG
ncbi:MAG TPA: hypothetical protein VGM05_19505 [Planctomycetaceae bacterium]